MTGVGIDRVPEWVEPAALEVVEAARVVAGFYRDMPERHREGGAAAALWWGLGGGSAPLTVTMRWVKSDGNGAVTHN
jgi:hypothetical protein